jgi:tetratricopeptide (TPR) repeat protein
MEKEAAEAARVAAEQAAEAARAAKDAENAAALTSAQKLYDAGQYDQALTALDSLLDTDPRNIDGWILHGRCMIKQKDDDHALEDFGRAVAIDPKRVDALQYRAFMFAQEQLYSDAIKDVDTILGMDASNGRAYKLRSDCDFQLGNMAKAREDAQKSCDLGYDDGCVAVKRLRSE